MQPPEKTLQLYTVNLVAKLCKAADVYDKRTLNDVLIDRVDAFIRHSLRHYLAQNPQAD